MHTVNEEKFFSWYRKNAKKPLQPESMLKRVSECYAADASEVFVLAPEETKSGEEARYAFRAECVGCCGASTTYFYF